ncbi:anti-phage protein KwaB [Sulfurovum sp.]|uniref:anti-phage protein KwaB n=1 Tax=Sulfurovum sp. TaxID=1969726 RepID=UPI003567C853
MNIEELRENLQYHVDNVDDIGITVYVLLKNDDSFTPKKLDIKAASLPELKVMFIQSLKENIINEDELSVLNLSSSDERLNTIYLYDLEVPEELAVMETILASDDHALFNIAEDDISLVKAFLIEIGDNENQAVLYKTLAPVNIFGRSSFFLKKSEERFEKINDEFLRISGGFQLMRLNDKLFVLDLKTIEKFFGFHDVIVREASIGLDAVEAINILENPETLRELVSDVKYARRFTKVAKSSPVLKLGISNDRIINFCKTYPGLAGRFRFNTNEEKLQLDTQVSKDLFIKLLMDDFLTSELTEYHYSSEAKDSVDVVTE